MTVLQILNASGVIVTAIATAVLTIITWRYVRLTRDILKTTNKPQIILFLRYEGGKVSLCVQNIGTGYASDVDFSGDLFSLKTIPAVHGDEGQRLKDLEPYKSGINYLGSGYKIDTFLFSGVRSSEVSRQTLRATVSYKDSVNTKEKECFTFKIGDWEDESQFISPQNDDTADRLSRIANALEHIRDHNRGNDTRIRNPLPFVTYKNVKINLKNVEELYVTPTRYNAAKYDLKVRYVSGTERILTTGSEKECEDLRSGIIIDYVMRNL